MYSAFTRWPFVNSCVRVFTIPRPRTTTFTFLALSTIVACTLGHHTEAVRQQSRVVRLIHNYGGHVTFEHEYDANGLWMGDAAPPQSNRLAAFFPQGGVIASALREYSVRVSDVELHGPQVHDSDIKALGVLRSLKGVAILRAPNVTDVGVSYLGRLQNLESLVVSDCDAGDTGLSSIRMLSQLRSVFIYSSSLTDAGLQTFVNMRHLELLFVHDSNVNGSGLSALSHLNIRALSLNGNPIDDDGIAAISSLNGLERLSLRSTMITDKSVSKLKRIRSLRHLDVHDSGVTGEGVGDLKQALPKCAITYTR